MYSLLLAIIYVAFVSLGLPDALVGAGWPAMQRDLDVPIAFAGVITMIIAGGTIVSSLASERLTRRAGAGPVTAISVAMTAAALFGFATSDSFWMLCLWALPYGLGAGAVDAALNNYVALHYAARHMNWLHACWGVGASISPFVISSALAAGESWTLAYLVIGVVQGGLTLALLLSLPLWRKVDAMRPPGQPDETPAEASDRGPTPHVPLGRAVRIPGVLAILAAFFAYCAVESTVILWASTFLVAEREVDAATAAAFASLFLLGITAGRFLAGIVADRIGDRWLIRGGFLAIGIGALLIAAPTDVQAIALAGLVLAGLGAAPIYPAIIHSTPVNFGRESSQAIIGIQMAAAYTGSTIAPPLFGALSSITGLAILPFFMLALVLVGIVASERVNRLGR